MRLQSVDERLFMDGHGLESAAGSLASMTLSCGLRRAIV